MNVASFHRSFAVTIFLTTVTDSDGQQNTGSLAEAEDIFPRSRTGSEVFTVSLHTVGGFGFAGRAVHQLVF